MMNDLSQGKGYVLQILVLWKSNLQEMFDVFSKV
jgi:hypothetical protein